MVGLGGALLLQRDGHDVTVLERDPAGVADPQRAWERWERRGVSQFRRPHGFLARFTTTVRAEMPDVATAFTDAGALEWSPLDVLPAAVTGGPRPGDDRFRAITGRRPLMEAVMARAAADAGVEIRRGAGVRGLVTTPDRDGRVDVQGVVTEQGEELRGRPGGRRRRPSFGDALLAARSRFARAEGGGRRRWASSTTRVTSGRATGPSLRCAVRCCQPYGSFSTATLPADHGTWSVVIFTASSDRALRRLHDERRVEQGHACLPAGRALDRRRTDHRDRRDGQDRGPPPPLRARRHPGGDRGRPARRRVGGDEPLRRPGLSIGFLHAVGLRDLLRTTPDRRPGRADAVVAGDDRRARRGLRRRHATPSTATAWPRCRPPPPVGPTRPRTRAGTSGRPSARAGPRDPDLLRKLLDVAQLLRRGREVLSEPGVVEQVLALDPGGSLPGPDREELLRLIA